MNDLAIALRDFPRLMAVEGERLIRATGDELQRSVARSIRHNRTGRTAAAVHSTVTGTGIGAVATLTTGGAANLLVGGTRRHVITPARRRALAWGGGGHPFASADNPGMRPDPFVQRGITAADPRLDQLLNEAGDRVAAAINDRT